jgi:hypothetical protein
MSSRTSANIVGDEGQAGAAGDVDCRDHVRRGLFEHKRPTV